MEGFLFFIFNEIKCLQVPGFQSFIIEAFATNCCLYSVLDKSFDFQDANTVSTMHLIFIFFLKQSILTGKMLFIWTYRVL